MEIISRSEEFRNFHSHTSRPSNMCYFSASYRLSSFGAILYYFNVNSFKYNGKILNLKYLININMLILTIYSEFPDYIIIVGKNQVSI